MAADPRKVRKFNSTKVSVYVCMVLELFKNTYTFFHTCTVQQVIPSISEAIDRDLLLAV